MGKEADLLFIIPVGMPFGILEEHEPLIVALFLLIFHAVNLDVRGMSEGTSWWQVLSCNWI